MQEMMDVYNRAKDQARTAMTDAQREALDKRPNAKAHDAAIVMVIGKLARIATGVPHADNYDDTIGYTKIAKKHAIKTK